MMQLKTYSTPQAYLLDTEEYLMQDELKHNLILGIMLSFKEPTQSFPHYFFISVFDQNKCVATSIKTWVKALVSCSLENDEAIELLAQFYLDNQIDLQGVFGTTETAEKFANYWCRPIDRTTHMLAHTLKNVNVINLPVGTFKQVDLSSLELVINYSIQFEEDAHLSARHSEEELRHSAKLRLEAGLIYGWYIHHQLVSIAGIVRQTKNYAIIALVFTPKEHRGKGYATAVVHHLSKSILSKGFQFGALYTDMANPTSNHIYQKIGYVPSYTFKDISFLTSDKKI